MKHVKLTFHIEAFVAEDKSGSPTQQASIVQALHAVLAKSTTEWAKQDAGVAVDGSRLEWEWVQ